jgi:uncharacterized damage-inducible protein DinB
MNIQEMKKLFAYNAWANNRVFEALSKIGEDEYTRDLKSSHGSLGETIVHMVAAEKIWLSRLVGKPEDSLMAPQDAPMLQSLKPIWEQVAAGMARFLAKLDDRSLQRDVEYTTTEGRKYSNSNEQILQHVVNHSSYHRGQIASMMRQVGAEPVNTDLIVFFRHTAIH